MATTFHQATGSKTKPQSLASIQPRTGVLQHKSTGDENSGAGGRGGDCGNRTRLGIQSQLIFNERGDVYEREANRIANQVMTAPTFPAISGTPVSVQRFSGPSSGKTATAPIQVDQALAEPGIPLAAGVRQDMEQHFGHDFSRVRVHSDTIAAQSAREVNAYAYTVGPDLVFGEGQFAPETGAGRHLLAHELTHYVQQSGGHGTRQHLQRQGMEPTDVPASAVLRDAPNAKTWSGAPARCGPDFCRPLPSEGMAIDSRKSMWPLFAAGIAYAVSSRVVPLWSTWAFGGSSSVLNLTADFGGDFINSLTTAKTTNFLLSEIHTKLSSSPPSVPPAGFVSLDIPTLIPGPVKAIDDPASPNQMNFNAIGEIPGNIAGGIGKDQAATPIGASPSPQNDERIAKGTLSVFDMGANLLVMPKLSYTVKDTIDLCPGDCGAAREQTATIPMSQWEATGISGDVPFSVDFPAPPLLALPFNIAKPAAPAKPATPASPPTPIPAPPPKAP
jgi:hypothetical protein